MIRYDLQCSQGHDFDGWFRDSAAFDELAAAGAVSCTTCGDIRISKQLMTPGIPVKSNRRPDVAGGTLAQTGPRDERLSELIQLMRAVRREVESKADYVGERFADEARKMHYQETELRSIYGEATFEEARALVEEGIDIAPLPRLPEDGN